MTRLLPLLLLACAPAEPPAPEVASIAACDDWGARKLGECADALARAPVPRNPDRQGRLHALSLTDQCVLFDSRRAALAGCTAMPGCEDYAACTVGIAVDSWRPDEDAGLCEAAVRRRLGTARPLIQEQIDAVKDPAARTALFEGLYGLTDKCQEDAEVRAAVGACMREYDEGFARCLVGLVSTS